MHLGYVDLSVLYILKMHYTLQSMTRKCVHRRLRILIDLPLFTILSLCGNAIAYKCILYKQNRPLGMRHIDFLLRCIEPNIRTFILPSYFI